jgi:hypothetical protein
MRILAIIAGFNEEDVISAVIEDLVHNGLEVYFIDNASTDRTLEEALRWKGRGLIGHETFVATDRDGAPTPHLHVSRQILARKEAIARESGADWVLHADADEFRESPWPNTSLSEGIARVDRSGYTAIDFRLFDFRPVDNSFVPGSDPRKSITTWVKASPLDEMQVRCWKALPGVPVDLVTSGGHSADFDGRLVFPVRFILRHYPIRSQDHGAKKMNRERKARLDQVEHALGWHLHYAGADATAQHLADPRSVHEFDPVAARLALFADAFDQPEVLIPARVARLWIDRDRFRAELADARSQVRTLEQELADARNRLGMLQAEFDRESGWRRAMERSWSWWLTRPVRALRSRGRG